MQVALPGRASACVYDNGHKSSAAIMDNLETRLLIADDPATLQLLRAKTPQVVTLNGAQCVRWPACQHTEPACAKVYVHSAAGSKNI